jgi:hypothetical protein
VEFGKSNDLDSLSSLHPQLDSQAAFGSEASLLGNAGKWHSMGSSFDGAIDQSFTNVTSGEQGLNLQFPSIKDSSVTIGDPLTGVVGTNPLLGNQGDKLLWGGTNNTNSSLVFIDSSVQDYQSLIAGIKPGTEVAVLDSVRNQVEQIGEYLAGRSNISSLHIVSHGDSGSLQLGQTKFGLDALNNNSNALQSWSKSLTADADILLYGCDVAQGQQGTAFVNQLSRITGADVAASTDLTGSAALGGDWNLEFDTGNIETPEIFQSWAVAAYNKVLATYTVTNTDDNGTGSLREAITQANLTIGVADTITFTGDIFIDTDLDIITLTSGELGITDDLIIQGTEANNLTINGNNTSRVFNISATNITLDNLTIANGNASDGGGILYSNSAGIFNITDSIISSNTATNTGGGLVNQSGTLNITNSTISSNTATNYGGLFNQGGRLNIINSTVSGNQAANNGGAMRNGFSGTSNISNSTFSGNQAGGDGGGIYVSSGTVNLTNSTITLNTADRDDNGSGGGGGIANFSTVNVKNTIIAGNIDASLATGTVNSDLLGNFTSQGNNLIGISDGPSGFSSESGDIVGTSAAPIDPKLGLLVNNGGTTQTQALLDGSLAINAGNSIDASPTDQRGFGRVGAVDIGAYELQVSNQAPVISLPSATLAYTENDLATVIDSGATVTDLDSSDFDNGTLTIQFADSSIAEDRLAIRNQGTAAGEIGVSDNNITYEETTIGTFAGGTDGSTPLAITFNTNATSNAAQALLQNITYENISDNPSTNARTVSFILTDGDTGTSNTATKIINITSVNDEPTLAPVPKAGNEDTVIAFTASDFIQAFSDIESNSLTKIQLTSLPETGTLTFNGNNVTANQEIAVDDLAQLSFTPAANFNGNISFNWNGFDGTSYATTGATVNLNVFAVNDAPVANSEARTTPRAQPITISRADLLGNDIDVDGDSLSINSFTQPSNGTLVDKGDGTFSYTPNIYFDGSDSFTYTISDGQGGTANSLVNLTVNTEDGIFNQVQLNQFLNTGDITNRDFNSLNFDEGFYLERNRDVAQAAASGAFQSGFQHFLSFGQAEGRNPSVLFDEDYYLANHQDVDNAVKAGAFRSGYDHFLSFGIFEGRNPTRLFDNNRYLADNQDVALAVENGALRSSFEHFLSFGQSEGRQPDLQLFNEDFYLDTNPDVAAAVAPGGFRSGFEHFILFGQAEGRTPSALFDVGFYLSNNPDVAQAVSRGEFRSGFEHFILFGRAEGRSAVS